MAEGKKIIIISDGSGKTAKRLLDAVMVQYQQKDLEFHVHQIFSEVRKRRELNRILEQIDDSYLVIYSIVSKEVGDYFTRKLKRHHISHLNVLKPMMDTMSKFLGFHPDYQPGLLQTVNDQYYRKVDAISYTVSHDDGQGVDVSDADAILVGPSRTCKTPISMYLSCNHGLRIANIPIVRDETMMRNLNDRLRDIHPRKVIGLLMRPSVLSNVREDRVNVLLSKDAHQEQMREYYDLKSVTAEHRYCRDTYITRGWQTVEVTRRAIEEISLEILNKLGFPT